MEEQQKYMSFTFTYNYVDGTPEYDQINRAFSVPDDAQWVEVMGKFVEFLSSVYGYDISKNVKYDLPRISNFDYNKL